MCMIDGNYPEFWSERKIASSRKEHRCDECFRTIRIGEPYWSAFGKQDGGTYTGTTCRHCRVIAEWLVRNCNGFLYSEIVEDFGNHAEGSIDMLRLVVSARRKWSSFADPERLLPVPRAPADMA
jgi:hypothetical protein